MASMNDKLKLDECIDILNSTDLGLSLTWLWVWDIIKYYMNDEDVTFTKTEDEVWNDLCKAVEADHGFSLEFGAEQIHEDVRDWLITTGIMTEEE